ncbi:MAG: HAD family hydrolase [Candidatus Thorarchaeota archaeon]|nr:MAG: HAD family hydrolase [Candidatus Thorarchaeota archaeon]
MGDNDKAISDLLETVRENPSYLGYWSVFKKIERLEIPPPEDETQLIRVAVIGSSTLEPVAACLDVMIRLEGLHPQTFIGGFNTFRQEALDPMSPFRQLDPDVVVLAVDAWSLLDQLFLSSFPRMNDKERKSSQKEIVKAVSAVAKELEKSTSALVLVNNFIVPVFSPLGVADSKQQLGIRDFFADANRALAEEFRTSNRVHVVDLDSTAAAFGKDRVVNWNTMYRGSIPFSEEFTPVVAEGYLRYIRAIRGLAKKCIVLDLDNTLWGGIIGEDGMEGIKLGNTSPGIEYVDFQRVLLSLYNRGIILAVNSKNNFEDAIKVLREHPYQVLREEHFAALRINWQNKPTNLIELAEEINIGLDSIVFIDDSPVEREQVRQTLPEVLVVDLPENPRLYRQTLENLDVFDVLSLTKEDMARGEMYVGKRKRAELERDAGSLDDFLKTLDLKVLIQPVSDFDTPRVVQLIGKTNQFNLTTRRYTDAQVQQFRDSEDSTVYSMAVTDKFGDEGVVGVAIVKANNGDRIIDSFLMSCRVIGRSVETAFLARIIADARAAGASRVIGEYIPTKKNPPASDLYERHGFGMPTTDEAGVTSWILNLDEQTVEIPEWIEVREE